MLRFWPGFHLRSHVGSLQRSPKPSTWINRVYVYVNGERTSIKSMAVGYLICFFSKSDRSQILKLVEILQGTKRKALAIWHIQKLYLATKTILTSITNITNSWTNTQSSGLSLRYSRTKLVFLLSLISNVCIKLRTERSTIRLNPEIRLKFRPKPEPNSGTVQ